MTNVPKLSPAISVENPTVGRDFYVKHFGAKVEFDCGWYISISIGDCELSFMKPQSSEQPMFDGKGLMYNFELENVDEKYNRLIIAGIKAIIPLEDHPWGDRGFGIVDSNGIILYFYKKIEPTEEFKHYFKNT